jgi:REP element-mobilizing transposase RayT
MERYRITSDAAVYYITYSIVEWLPVFTSEAAFRIITDSFNYCHKEKGLRINAFVIMPTHLHAIVHSVDFRSEPLAAALTDFRKFTGRKLSDYCREFMPPCFHQTLRECSGEDRERRFCQPSRHPVAVQTEKFWRQKLEYLHENPGRKGLVRRSSEWRYSSALWYDTDAQHPCDVHLTGINWT